MSDRRAGSIVWFRKVSGHGLVKADAGPRYFFFDEGNRLNYETGLRVTFLVTTADNGQSEASSFAFENGIRRIIDDTPPPPAKKKSTRSSSKSKSTTAKKKAEAPKTPRRRRPGARAVAEEPQGRWKGKLVPGTSVVHATFGGGHVLSSTANLVQVQFFNEKRSRTVNINDVKPSTDSERAKAARRGLKRPERRTGERTPATLPAPPRRTTKRRDG